MSDERSYVMGDRSNPTIWRVSTESGDILPSRVFVTPMRMGTPIDTGHGCILSHRSEAKRVVPSCRDEPMPHIPDETEL